MIRKKIFVPILGFLVMVVLASGAHAQSGGVFGGGNESNPLGRLFGNDGKGGGLGSLLGGGSKSDSNGSLNLIDTIRQTIKSAQNSNLGPVGKYVLGRELAARMVGYYKVVDKDDLRLVYLRNVVVNLLYSSRLPKNYRDPVVILLDEPGVVNAFAAPGGFVFITTGMLDFVENEDELAFVLAHEIAHIEMDHGLNAVKQNEGAKLFKSATGDLGFSGLFGEFLTMAENGFSKDLEGEADLRGGEIAGSLGYDWTAGVTVIERLEAISSRKHGIGYPANRAANIREGAGSYNVPAEVLAARTKRFIETVGK